MKAKRTVFLLAGCGLLVLAACGGHASAGGTGSAYKPDAPGGNAAACREVRYQAAHPIPTNQITGMTDVQQFRAIGKYESSATGKIRDALHALNTNAANILSRHANVIADDHDVLEIATLCGV